MCLSNCGRLSSYLKAKHASSGNLRSLLINKDEIGLSTSADGVGVDGFKVLPVRFRLIFLSGPFFGNLL